MEYARRRRRRKREKSGAGRAILLLLVTGGLIYLLAVSTVGTWLVENMFTPLIETVDAFLWGKNEESLPEQESAVQLGGGEAGVPAVTEEATIAAMNCYALQTGVFSENANARQEAEGLQQLGGGGYILEKDGKFRVLAAGYAQEESLRQVQQQLRERQMDSTAYLICAPETRIRITGTQSQVAAVQSAVQALQQLQRDLGELVLTFDRDGLTAAQGREKVTALLQTVSAANDAYTAQVDGENDLLGGLRQCLAAGVTGLEQLLSDPGEDATAFSAALKFAHLAAADAYRTMAEAMAAME